MRQFKFPYKQFSLFFFLVIVGTIFLSHFAIYSFAASFTSDGTNNWKCRSSNSTSDNAVMRDEPNNPDWPGPQQWTYCASNEICTDSTNPDTNPDKNVATCHVASATKQITHYTCHTPDSAAPNNQIDAVQSDGTVIQNYKACASDEYCHNTNGTAQCLPDTCTCTGTKPYTGSGNNGLHCTAKNGSTVDTACSTLQGCVDNTNNPTKSACQQLLCSCDFPDSTQAGQNGFVCQGGTKDTCQGNEICTGAPGQATCKFSSQAGSTTDSNTLITPPPPPCAITSAPNSAGQLAGCGGVDTAFGIWSTDAAGFVKSLFGILLSLSGGIAVLMIMFGGYKMMMSQGDPEKIQGAKEQVTSAIIGILFLVFSLVILQVIGVDILHLPGFSN